MSSPFYTNKFIHEIRQVILEHDMLHRGDHVIVALSGGADSVCLLLTLTELSGDLGISISALHVHHGLRAAADEDEEFVRSLCRRKNIHLTTMHVDAAGYAAEHKLGIEEAARVLRYEELERARRRMTLSGTAAMPDGAEGSGGAEGAHRVLIAVAHHLEDQAETVLFHLCRGTSIGGMRGMQPVSSNIIRPLLSASRADIEAYLRGRGQEWRTDETNADTAYTRNYLRGIILPGLKESVNAKASEHIARFAEEAAQMDDYLELQARKGLARCRYTGVPADSVYSGDAAPSVSIPVLEEYPLLLQKRILYQFLTDYTGRKKDITDAHIAALMSLCEKGGSGQISLPYDVTAVKTYDSLLLRSTPGKREPHTNTSDHADLSSDMYLHPAEGSPMTDPAQSEFGTIPFPDSSEQYACRVLEYDGSSAIPRGAYTKWLDYDKIGTFPVFRTRQPGDHITVSDSGLRKKLTRYMIDVKIPSHLREQMVLPFCGSDALWVPGHQINAAYKVSDATTRVLEIRVKGAEQAQQ